MKQLVQTLKKLLKDNKIEDIIIFGSYVKGKLDPSDLDLAIISNETLDQIKIKKEIETLTKTKIDLQFLSIKDLEKTIHLTLIKEGYSVKHNDFIYNNLRIKPIVLFKYSLKELTPSKKVMFERAINNFKEIEKLSNRVVLVPINKSEEFSEFIKNWGLEFETKEYELLPIQRKEI